MEVTGRIRFFVWAAYIAAISFCATGAILLPQLYPYDSLLLLGLKIFTLISVAFGALVLLFDRGFLMNYRTTQHLVRDIRELRLESRNQANPNNV